MAVDMRYAVPMKLNGNSQKPQVEITEEQLVVLSAMADRFRTAKQMGIQYGGDRDIWEELGYKTDIRFSDYKDRFKRDGMSKRMITKPAKDTWRNAPTIKDGEESETKFTQEFDALATRIRLWKQLTDLDVFSGIGSYGIMLIGVKGEGELKDELEGTVRADDIIFLRTYDEGEATIKIYEKDKNEPRFGKPLLYEVDLGRVGTTALSKVEVHWSRVIHAAENSRDGVIGVPRLEASFNRLFDMEKIVGSGAEAVWRLIYKGLAAQGKEGFQITEESGAALEDEMAKYLHGFSRQMILTGAELKELGTSETPDPSGMFKILISLIAADMEMPQNILIGSEQGVRASDVDAQNWAGAIDNRQTQFAEPVILRPFIDWCIGRNVISNPSSGSYEIEWQPPFTMTDTELLEQGEKQAKIIGETTKSGAIDFGNVTKQEVRGMALLPEEMEGESVEDMLDREDELPEEFAL